MSDLLSIGASGVRAYQNALTTVSENIAGSGAAGYARRKAGLSEVIAPGTSGPTAAKFTSGMGVAVTGVERQADAYKTAAARSAGADLSKTSASVEWLGRIEGALTGAELPARVTGFFNAARQLAADPASAAPRAAMLESAQAVAGAFRATGQGLERTRAEIDETARDLAEKFDGYGRALAATNEKVQRAAPGSSASAALADERDRLLEEMSAIADIDAATDSIGRATVRMGGRTGPVYLQGAEVGDLAYSRGETGAASFAVYRAGEATLIQPSGGALGAVADASARAEDALVRVSKVAGDFAAAVNAVQAQGRDLNGVAGEPLFEMGGDGLEVAFTDPSGVAAAAGGGARDGSNLDGLEQARKSGGFESALTNLTTSNAAALEQRKLVADAQSAIRDGAIAARDAVSGVDLDQEAVDLVRFQQAYSASSRVIQVARDTFQSILEIR